MKKHILSKITITLLIICAFTITGCSKYFSSKSSKIKVPSGTTQKSGSSGKTGDPPARTNTGTKNNAIVTGTAAYTLNGGAANKSIQTIIASKQNQSGVKVINGGKLTLDKSTIKTSGSTSSFDTSSIYGLNAGVLAESRSNIALKNSTVTTNGTGTSAIFATGTSTIALSDTTVKTTSNNSHGITAASDGTITARNIKISTNGTNSAAIAANYGTGTMNITGSIVNPPSNITGGITGGIINITGGTISTAGKNSPAIYSAGKVTVTGAKLTSTGSEAAVIDGYNSITLIRSILTSAKNYGVRISQIEAGTITGGITTPGTAGKGTATGTSGAGTTGVGTAGTGTSRPGTAGTTGGTTGIGTSKPGTTGTGTTVPDTTGTTTGTTGAGTTGTGYSIFKMTGGSLTAAGPLFYVTNTTARIELNTAVLKSTAGKLITAASQKGLGIKGFNGANVILRADHETLSGDIICDNLSTVAMDLINKSNLKGIINKDNKAKSVSVTLDKTSMWNVTGNSYITVLKDADTTLSNIKGNGHTIYYKSTNRNNNWLHGKTYNLKNGGKLVPVK